MSVVSISRMPEGLLVTSDDVPIGLIGPDGAVQTPSGTVYRVTLDGAVTLATPDGKAVASVNGLALLDEQSGVEWALRENWERALRDNRLDLDEVWARPYTLEEAQGTVPNRVRLLLARLAARAPAGGEE